MTEHVSGASPTKETLREEMFRQATDAFEHCVSRYSVGLVFGERGQHVDTASGVAVAWRGRHVIVTAKHVFPEGAEDQGVTLILPRDRPLHRGDGVGQLPPNDLDCVIPMPRVAVVRSNSEDLAYFEVNRSIGDASDVEYYELPSIAVTPPSGTRCALSGFPEDLSGRISDEEVVVRLANRWSEVAKPGTAGRFLKGFDSEAHFLMEFRKADKGKRPEGFSGGGVWFPLRQSSDTQLWRAVPGLAGVQSAWFPNRALTLSVRVECLVRFLDQALV